MSKCKESNNKIAISLLALFCSMLLLSFAAVPIYDLFCKATGFGGTVQRAKAYMRPEKGTKKIKIEFDSNVDKNLPWQFYPKQRSIETFPGENLLVFYQSKNMSEKDIIGTSVYNVTPLKAGKYFVKIHCFCFEEQLLRAGQESLMPVTFYIDPEIENDPEMEDVDTITLSYSFFLVRQAS